MIFLIRGIADHYLSGPIDPALLKMIALGYSIIIVAAPTGLLGTVGYFAIDIERASIESFQNNLFMEKSLRRDRGGIDQADGEKDCDDYFLDQSRFPSAQFYFNL
jgi:hypothetical protein